MEHSAISPLALDWLDRLQGSQSRGKTQPRELLGYLRFLCYLKDDVRDIMSFDICYFAGKCMGSAAENELGHGCK